MKEPSLGFTQITALHQKLTDHAWQRFLGRSKTESSPPPVGIKAKLRRKIALRGTSPAREEVATYSGILGTTARKS